MTAMTSRLFAGPSDAARIIAFVRSIRPIERVTDYPSVANLPELFTLPQNQTTTRLWFSDTDHLLGFAFVDVFHTLRFDLAWQDTTPALEAALVAWGDACLKQTLPSGTAPLVLYASCHEADTRRQAFLTRHHFTPLADYIVHMARPLADPIPILHLPPGFSIRPVDGIHEAAELAALHRAAFGTPYMTTERRLTMMRMAHYDPTLDFVALAPDGTRAAYGMGSVSDEENLLTQRHDSYADLFATDPAYRGLGLARALGAAILRLLQTRGFDTAKLGTGSENRAMQQVATSLGFRIVSMTRRFSREVATE